MIKVTDKTGKYLVSTYEKTETGVYNAVYDIVGDELHPVNGIPLAQEIAGWADLATIGEVYETEKVRCEIVEDR